MRQDEKTSQVISIEQIRNMMWYQSHHNQVSLPSSMVKLVRVYAEKTCRERFTCAKFGMIRCCLQCFCDEVLIEDMEQKIGGNIADWKQKARDKK